MAVELNHTIIWCQDNKKSAYWTAELLGLPEPYVLGPFYIVAADNNVTLDFLGIEFRNQKLPDPTMVAQQHYCYLVTEAEFDEIFGRIKEQGLEYYADSFHKEPNQINHNDGGRGVYFLDLDGHNVEVITVPYGGFK
ncbi:VOC family protein [Actinophytocola sp.]|uniref:VOC family protein n=1 Tax=Actinophytocola sp. TaxID=1872138 RepID=UPI002D7F4B2D|nr:VOC family protein [Actinophytocola sp.]HET9140738.1 VOC family protein [Actinophytocola sp.]